MARPTLGDAPTVEELAAVACPVDRFTRISRYGRVKGTLPGHLAAYRLVTLAEAMALPNATLTAIAERAETSLGRLSQLFARIRRATGQEPS